MIKLDDWVIASRIIKAHSVIGRDFAAFTTRSASGRETTRLAMFSAFARKV